MRTRAVIIRICQQMLRDKRTLALLFVAPLLILSLMYFLFNGSTNVNLNLGVVNIDKSTVQILENSNISTKEYTTVTGKTIVEDKLDGLLQMTNGKLILTLQNSDPSTSQVLQMRITQAMATQFISKLNVGVVKISPPSIKTKYIYGSSKTSFFDIFSSILVGFFVFFFVFLISGIGLLRERTTGTLERFMSTPIKRREVITGYLVGYGIFAVIQTLIVVTFAINVLNLAILGSIWNVILINLILALVALSLGILLSTFAASEFQMIQFIPLVVIPQVFFAGIFPVEGMANWLQVIAKFMPIYYGADALKKVMYKGLGFSDIGMDLLALVIFATIFIVLNTFALKKYRKL